MKQTEETKQLECGCKTVVTLFKNTGPIQQQHWAESISVEDLEHDLGPSSEAWFDNLSHEHELLQEDVIPPNRQVGWSPCPAGGVVNISESTSAACGVEMMFPYDSPVLWPTLLPDSPEAQSTMANSSIQDGLDNSVSSLGLRLDGDDGEDGEDKRSLDFGVDVTDLSWSSSMATPVTSDLGKFTVTEQAEKEKGTARALFTPNNSADDSELGLADADLTIEQEASMSLFAADDTLTAPPVARQPLSAGVGGTCGTPGGQPVHNGSVSCSCGVKHIPVLEIHCSDRSVDHHKSVDEVCESAGQIQAVVHAVGAAPQTLCSNTEAASNKENNVKRHIPTTASTPKGKMKTSIFTESFHKCEGGEHCRSQPCTCARKHARLCLSSGKSAGDLLDGNHKNLQKSTHLKVGCELLKDSEGKTVDVLSPSDRTKNAELSEPNMQNGGVDFGSPVTPRDHHGLKAERLGTPAFKNIPLDTSTPKTILATPASTSTPDSQSSHSQRSSLRRRGKPRELASRFAAEEARSVDEALADFFSSPETTARQRRPAPGKRKKKVSLALDYSVEMDTVVVGLVDPDSSPVKSSKDEVSLAGGMSMDNLTCVKDCSRDKFSLSSDVKEETQGVSTCKEGSVNSVSLLNILNASFPEKDIDTKDAITSSKNPDQTPQKSVQTHTSCMRRIPSITSPGMSATPPSILRSSGKQKQASSSAKRVRFSEECNSKSLRRTNSIVSSADVVCERDFQFSDTLSSGIKDQSTKDRKALEEKTSDPSSDELDRELGEFVFDEYTESLNTPSLSVSDGSRPQLIQMSLEESENPTTKASHNASEMMRMSTSSATTGLNPGNGRISHDAFSATQDPTCNVQTDQGMLSSKDSNRDQQSVETRQQVASGQERTEPVKGSQGSVCRQENLLPESVVKTQGAGVAVSSGTTQSRHAGKGENTSITPAGPSVMAQPKLRLGLRKTPRFLYPTSSQILETCPQNVYNFKAVTTPSLPQKSVGQPPTQKDQENKAACKERQTTGENSSGQRTADTSNTSTSSLALPECGSRTDSGISTLESIASTKPNTLETRNVEDTQGTSTGGVLSQNSTMCELDEDDMTMLENADWSDAEECVVNKTLPDAQKSGSVKQTQSHGMSQVPLLTKASSLPVEVSPCKSGTPDRPLEEIPPQPVQASGLKPHMTHQGMNHCRANLALVTHTAQTPSVPSSHTISPGKSKPVPALSTKAFVSQPSGEPIGVPLTSEGKVHGKECMSGGLDEGFQEDLLCGVDFSQELSQSKSSLDPVKNGGAEALGMPQDKQSCPVVMGRQSNSSKSDGEKYKGKDIQTVAEVCENLQGKSAENFSSHIHSDAGTPLSLVKNRKETELQKPLQGLHDTERFKEFTLQEDKTHNISGDFVITTRKDFGFTSAAGKTITLTEKALTAARTLFQDENMESDCPGLSANVKNGSLECTVNTLGEFVIQPLDDGKSGKCLRARSVMQEDKMASVLTIAPDSDRMIAPDSDGMTSSLGISGFKTASGKDFSVSSKGKRKAEELWRAVEKELHADTSDSGTSSKMKSPVPCSAVAQMSDDLHGSSSVSTDSATMSSSSSKHDSSELSLPVTGGPVGFKTAGGRAFILSTKSQQRAAQLWKSVEKENNSSAESLEHRENRTPVADEVHSGIPLKPRQTVKNRSEDAGIDNVNSSKTFKSPLPAGSSRDVPQGFRPFKPPTIIKQVSEEDRYTTKIPEESLAVRCGQSNTILHHFTKAKASSEDAKGLKRKRSDDFSDDDEDTWDMEGIEEMESCGHRQTEEQQTTLLPTPQSLRTHALSVDSESQPERTESHSVTVIHNLQANISCKGSRGRGEITGERGHKAVTSQTQNDCCSQGSNSTGDGTVLSVSLKSFTDGEVCSDENQDTSALADQVMSEVVLTELSHDMHETTQVDDDTITQMNPSHPLSEQNGAAVHSDLCATVGTKFLRMYSTTNLALPPQGSPKSQTLGDVSFESLRCDESVSYDEEDVSNNQNHPASSVREDRSSGDVLQKELIGVKEIDFDSSIPDPTEIVKNDSDHAQETNEEEDVEDMDSSFMEKEMTDISCLERELDASQVEISGGVVWMDRKDSDVGSPSSVYLSADAVKEEKYDNTVLEASGSSGDVSIEMKDMAELLADNDFDACGLDTEWKDGGHTLKRKVGVSHPGEYEIPQGTKRPRAEKQMEETLSECDGTAEHAELTKSSSAGKCSENKDTSPTDSLGDVSWTDIMCTFNPSPWKDGKAEQDSQTKPVSVVSNVEGPALKTNISGDAGRPALISADCTSSKKVDSFEKDITELDYQSVDTVSVSMENRMKEQVEKRESLSEDTTSSKRTVSFEDNLAEFTNQSDKSGSAVSVGGVKESREPEPNRESLGCEVHHLWPDSEGFAITAGFSQVFPSQVSQDTIGHQHKETGDEHHKGRQSHSPNSTGQEGCMRTSDGDTRSVGYVSHCQNSITVQQKRCYGSAGGSEHADMLDSSVTPVGEAGKLGLGKDSTKDEMVHQASSAAEKRQSLGLGQCLGMAPDDFGFQMASGKSVSVSEESLKRVKHLFDEDVISYPSQDQSSASMAAGEDPSVSRPGFQTAAGKSVSVSEVALENPTCLFDKEEENMEDHQRNVSSYVPSSSSEIAERGSSAFCIGFQTASGKSMSISEQSLEKVKLLFDEGVENLECLKKNHSSSGQAPVSESTPDQCRILFEPKYSDANSSTAGSVQRSVGGSSEISIENNVDRSTEYDTERQVDLGDGKNSVDSSTEFDKERHVDLTLVTGEEKTGKSVDFDIEGNTGTSAGSVTDKDNTDQNNSDAIGKVLVPNELSATRFGFQTVGGEGIAACETSLTGAGNLMKSFDDKFDVNSDKINPVPIPAASSFPGFQTAGGTVVSVSRDALHHARRLLDCEKNHASNGGEETAGDCEHVVLVDNRFQRARENRKYCEETDSEQSPHLTKTVLDRCGADNRDNLDRENRVTSKDSVTDNINFRSTSGNTGFHTARGKKVSVSARSLQQARRVLDSTENIHGHETDKGGKESLTDFYSSRVQLDSRETAEGHGVDQDVTETHTDAQPPEGLCRGFQTARGNTVSVSEKALKNARKVLDSNLSEANQVEMSVVENKGHSSSLMCGFQTARGNTVTVSEKALENAKRILESDDSAAHDQAEVDVIKGNSRSQTYGFQTARGKTVTVSMKALKNARKILDKDMAASDDQGETRTTDKESPHPQKAGMCGFQTASGGSVHVSAKALQHAKTLMMEGKDAENTDATMSRNSCGFQTAGGGSVSVSHKALQHAQTLFSESAELLYPVLESQPTTKRAEENHLCSEVSSLSEVKQNVSTSALGESQDVCEASTHQQQQALADRHGNRDQGRRSKEGLVPVVSDDSRMLATGEERKLSGCGVVATDDSELHRVAVKRSALYADSEAILHDRSAKRCKLQPVSAGQNSPSSVPAPFSVPQSSTPHTSNPPHRRSHAGKAATAFQPPYKKPKFNPPPAKIPGGGSNVSGKSEFKVPSALSKEKDVHQESSYRDEPGGDVVLGCVVSGQQSCGGEKGGNISNMDQGNYSGLDRMGNFAQTCERNKQSGSASEVSNENSGLAKSLDSDKTDPKQSLQSMIQPECTKEASCAATEARMQQEKLIRQKKRQKIQPTQGRWLTRKLTEKQTTLEDLHLTTRWRGKQELLRLGVNLTICSVTSRNAEDFRFYLPSFYPGGTTGVLVGDGALLVADRHSFAGKEEFYLAFLTLDGVDPGLLTETWLYNHYRWVVWKLAAYEVTLPQVFAARALTPDMVMYQLKYRYDREVDKCQRSALKRIVERDDTACKRLVLCVSDITHSQDSEQAMIEVTDGWYCLPCKPDSALQELIDSKKLVIGQKIVTTGAELAGSQESCSPLELCAGLHLKIHGNSTRPAPAGAKLGYQGVSTPLCVPLSTLHPQGGLVGCVDMVVVRKYPLMFMEKLPKGGCVFRTVEMEEKARRKHEERRQTLGEKLCSQLQAEMEKEEESARRARGRRSLKPNEIKSLTSGAEISDAMDTVSHPEELQGMLSSTQVEQLIQYRRKQQDQRQQQLNERLQQALQQSSAQEERVSVPVQKLRVVGCCRQDIDNKSGCLLTVWRPGEDWDTTQEGKRYRIFSLTAAPARLRCLGRRVELTAGRHTRLQAASIEENLLDLIYEPREVSCVTDLQSKNCPYGEFDFVGMAVCIKTALRGSDAVYAVDVKGNILLIWFWGGLQAFSLQDMLKEGEPFAASNLRFKCAGKDLVECSASLELSLFSPGGKTVEQRELVQRFRHKDWREQMLVQGREKVSCIRSSRVPAVPVTEELEDLPPSFLDKLFSPFTQETNHHHHTPSTGATSTNNSSSTPQKSCMKTTLNSSNDSSDTAAQPLSPYALEINRKRKAQREKLARLQSYGRAPTLSPLPSTVSPAACKGFKPLTPHRK